MNSPSTSRLPERIPSRGGRGLFGDDSSQTGFDDLPKSEIVGMSVSLGLAKEAVGNLYSRFHRISINMGT
jgi:hypothetical protein